MRVFSVPMSGSFVGAGADQQLRKHNNPNSSCNTRPACLGGVDLMTAKAFTGSNSFHGLLRFPTKE
jgi:hypothetical protein